MKDSTTLETLVRRIDVLERQNRQFKFGMFVLIVLATGLTVLAAQVPSPKAPVTLTIEYAGTRYSGWQIQKNARTVQGEIDRAVRTVTGRSDFELYGSGRTDAGVHALAQVAHLDVSTTVPADSLRRRVNDELPADINIMAA